MLEELLQSGFQAQGLTPEPRALERYRVYYEYLEEMNQVMNLTAISGEEDVARLHFLDCTALLGLADFAGRRVIDVGTGAGFPGLAMKMACPVYYSETEGFSLGCPQFSPYYYNLFNVFIPIDYTHLDNKVSVFYL